MVREKEGFGDCQKKRLLLCWFHEYNSQILPQRSFFGFSNRVCANFDRSI